MHCTHFPEIMVSMAQNRKLSEVLRAIVTGICDCPHVALARIWLLNPGDLCAKCRFRDECSDKTRCLHLVASAGNSLAGTAHPVVEQTAFNRYPLGRPHLGVVAMTAESVREMQFSEPKDWIVFPHWVASEKIVTFAAQPLLFQGDTLGVLEVWDREPLASDDFQWLRIFADHAAMSIVNAKALEEIALLKEQLEEENSYLREEVNAARGRSDLVGESPALRKVQQQIELVARTDATVLVTGESGTGKELVARAIHARSLRASRSMITVNCAAVPEPLFESEFFGHAKGAFTGALRDKAGRFEIADGGTLFLDEIGEIPLAMQAKLLRVLQEHEVERVGDLRSRKVNVRIIAATNRNLKAEVEAGRFRQDLFYRLSVFPIENPPLRDRREDIPPLAEHFLRAAAKRMNCKPPKLTKATARQLAEHDWPGNVRELQNAIERAVILAQGGPLRFDPSPVSRSIFTPPPQIPDGSAVFTRADLKQRERESIAAALAQTNGKVYGPYGAAILLGMKPSTLTSRINALGLRRT
jgi:transcriptional regulator with GAF, ATPase, and Fis domain